MEDWVTQVERLSRERAPGMTAQHARDLADDLYRAWPESTPEEVVAKFFAFMPRGWNAAPRH
jgi:hypothetical protein